MSNEQAEFDEQLIQKAKRAKDTLRNTMADLGRELRQQVQAKESIVFNVSDVAYHSAFTAGHLLRDEDRRFRFVWGKS